MNPIDSSAAEIFFADHLLPLRRANLRRGIAYLDCGERRPSYWVAVVSRTGGLACLAETACAGAALLDHLGAYWRQQGEPDLPRLLPALEALRLRLARPAPDAAPHEATLTDFVYPLF